MDPLEHLDLQPNPTHVLPACRPAYRRDFSSFATAVDFIDTHPGTPD